MKRRLTALLFLFIFTGYNICAVAQELKYPDYAYEFLGPDKHENYNRKMFNFDRGLNKYVLKPIHIIWASILPQYGMDRIMGITHNIEFPIRCVSSLVQRDFKNAGRETKRFLINTTIGLAGMFDPARSVFKLERSRDNMDKAFARCNIKPGPYFVAPVIVFTTVRGLFGRVFDMALNPSTYIGTPILAAIKAGIAINRTTYWQSLIQIVESSYADPYEITKKAFGIDSYIKKNNFDRVNVKPELIAKNVKPVSTTTSELNVSAQIINTADINQTTNELNSQKALEKKLGLTKISLEPDIKLQNYYPQSPVVDSLRTSLFILPEVNKSIWNEMSPWNRSFANKIKSDSVNIVEGRPDYTFRYMLQKDKNAPLAILYPSTGDGVKASHPTMFAKLFYDAGYSVIIQGNPFQWEFVQSMDENYRPGMPAKDALVMRAVTLKIIDKLRTKYNCEFNNKIIFGTSLAGIDVLFMAELESRENTLGDAQFIAVCPPIDLLYSIRQVDNYADEWIKFPDDLKQKVAYASAKIVDLYLARKDMNVMEASRLPFDEDEAKLITSFMMHQKLSDIIFTIEHAPTNKKSDIYQTIYSMGYEDYMNKYIIACSDIKQKEYENSFGLMTISPYLQKANNYKIYHSVNDYLVNQVQLKQLKKVSGGRLVLIDNGSHMGFLYRPEFLNDLRKTITEMKNAL